MKSHKKLHKRRAKDLPRIADVGQFFWPSVQATRWKLSLGQPPAKQVGVDPVQLAQDGEETHTTVDLAGVTLRPRSSAEPAVEVHA